MRASGAPLQYILAEIGPSARGGTQIKLRLYSLARISHTPFLQAADLTPESVSTRPDQYFGESFGFRTCEVRHIADPACYEGDEVPLGGVLCASRNRAANSQRPR